MYKSQWKQDYLLNKTFFHNKTGGVFVDVGAHDGVTLSNTYFFEKTLGWTGMCIEPLSNRYKELTKNRSCVCINACAYHENGKVDFLEVEGYSEMLSGIRTEYDARHLTRLNHEVKIKGGSAKTVSINAYRLETLFDDFNIKVIDYLTIDTEGSELNVLRGINFDKVMIHVIDVENNYPDKFEPIKKLLLAQNYRHVDTIGGDEIFVHLSMMLK